MAVELMTESDARSNWRGSMLHAKPDRNLLYDFRLISVRAAIVMLVTLPIWRPDGGPFAAIAYWQALLVAMGLLAYNYYITKDLKLARQPEAWLINASSEAIFIKFRSYKLPSGEDEIVLGIPAEDVEVINVVRSRQQNDIRLDITLKEPMPEDILRAILLAHEKAAPSPVQLHRNYHTLRLQWEKMEPALGPAIDKLRLYYRVDPPRSVANPDEELI